MKHRESYADTLRRLEEEASVQAAAAAVIGAEGTSPQQVLKYRQLAAQTGAPMGAVKADPEGARRAVERKQLEDLRASSPSLARWLTDDGDRYALARDDIGNLSKLGLAIERTYKATRDYGLESGMHTFRNHVFDWRNIGRAAPGGQNGIRASREAHYLEELAGAFSSNLKRAEAKYATATRALLPESLPESIRGSDFQHAVQLASIEREAQQREVTQSRATEQAFKELEAASKGGLLDALQAWATNPRAVGITIAQSLGLGADGLAMTAATAGSSRLVTAVTAGATSGQTEYASTLFEVMKESGVDLADPHALRRAMQNPELMEKAKTKAAQRGLVVGAFDFLTAGLAGHFLKNARANLGSISGAVAAEAGLQVAGGSAGELTAQLVTGDKVNWVEVVGEGFAEIGMGAGEVHANYQTAKAHGELRTQRETLQTMLESDAGARQLGDIMEAAQASQLAQQSPEAFAELLSSTTSPDANVYLDVAAARTLFQSERIGADAFIDELVGEQGAAFEAAATGGDLVIPLADFVAKLAHRPDTAEIARHARLDAGHVSRAELESESFMDEQLAKWFGDTDEAAARAQPVESEAGRERVKQDVLGMLMATGRYKGADAEANAEALSLMVGRLADMAGVDPWEHYARYRLRINNRGGQQVAGQKPNTIDPVSDGLLMDALNGVMPSESAERREEIQSILRALDEHEVLREKSPSELAAMNRQDIWDMLFPVDVLNQSAAEDGNILESAGFRQWFGDKSIDELEADYAALTDDKGRKLTDDGHHIDTDLVRELAPAYRADRSLSGQLHPYASALTKELFKRALARPVREGKSPVVAFLAGGGGSGKSTAGGPVIAAISPDITMDGTLSSLKGARQNIEASLASGRGVEVVFVYRSPEKSVAGAIGRAISKGRPVPVSALAEGHSQAPENVKTLAKEYNDNEQVKVRAIWNDGELNERRGIPVEELPHVDREQAERIFRDAVESERAAGKLPDKLYSAFSDGSAGRLVREVSGGTEQANAGNAPGYPLTLHQSPAESGASSLEAEIAAERAATERAYGGRAAYDKAKAEGRTKLTYHQWIEVRTPRFKQWFGNWEAVRGVELLESAQPLPLDDVPPLADKKAVENAFRSFDMPANRHDGRKVRFPVSTAGKVVRHKGFDIASVAGAFDRLFESAVPMMSQVEQAREGHKDHTRNIEGYHHYVNRFTRDGKTYYVRFAVQQMLGSRKQAGESLLHSAFVSSVEIYEQNKGAAPETVSVWESPVLTAGATPYDSILSQWLEAGKQGASKVIDPETGEPLVVYHGTAQNFDAFDNKKTGANDRGLWGRGHYFASSANTASSYAMRQGDGAQVMPAFVALKNPLTLKTGADLTTRLPDGRNYRELLGSNLDGSKIKEIALAGNHDGVAQILPSGMIGDVVAYSPNQIKSATANNGNYSADADSTLEQRKADKPRGQIRFLPERAFSIDLFEGADGSTFMHEAAHFVLEQMQDLAEQSEAVKAELDRVRAWLGNEGGKFTTDEHERFARGFELYLREGKAPVPGLRRLFERMKNWLMQAYKHALELNVALNDDIRGVFDRLLASEAEIEAAKRKQGDNPLALSKEARGLLKAGQYEKYVEAREAALAEAREALLAKLNAAERRKHEQWWKKELKELVAQKLAEIDASPAGRAQQRMRADKSLRLDKAALVARYGKAWTQDSLRALGVYTVKGRKSASSPAVLAATMERGAQTLDEARKHARAFVGQPLTNQSTGLEARVSNTNLGKMTSEKAGKKSSTAADHALAVANVDKLFRNALLDHSHADSKGEPTIAAIHRYVAPMVTHDGRVVAVKMTVKETTGPKEPNPVYSIETLDIQNPPSVLSRVNPDGTGIHPQAGFNANVLQRMDEVKSALQPAGGGLNPETAAMLFGFDSGDALVKALADLPDMRARAKDWALSEMYARHGDPMTDGSLPEAAMEAIHGNKRLQLLEKELGLLSELAGQPFPPLAVVREYARRKVAATVLRRLRPHHYLVAERKAARETVRAVAQGNYAAALAAKRQQAVQAMLYSEALKARDVMEKRLAAFKKAGKHKARERVGKQAGKPYLDALDALLHTYGLHDSKGPVEVQRGALREWLNQMQTDGMDTAVSERILLAVESGKVLDVHDMTIEAVEELHEALKNLLHHAREEGQIRTAQGVRDFAEVKAEMLATIDRMKARKTGSGLSDADKDLWQRLRDLKDGIFNWFTDNETMIEWLDGGDTGIFHDALWNAAQDADSKHEALKRQVGAMLQEVLGAGSKEARKALDDTHEIRSLGCSLSGHTILSALLNMGTESNQAKMVQGGAVAANGDKVQLTPEVLAEMFSKLSREHALMVRGIWDAVGSLWPEIVAMQEAAAGFSPPRVEAMPVTIVTKDGPVALRGGYYPMAYDPKGSKAGQRQEESAERSVQSGHAPVRAATSKGYLQARTNYSGPVLLDYHQVISRHLDGVMADIAWRQPLRQVQKILKDPEIRSAIDRQLGPQASKYMLGNFERGAVGSWTLHGLGAQTFGHAQKVIDRGLVNITSAALGFRVPLAIGNIVTAPILASSRVPPMAIAQGYAEYYRDMAGNTRAIHALSPMMQRRAEARSLEMQAVLDSLRGKRGKRQAMIELGMSVQQWVVPLAENAIWLGAFRHAMRKRGMSQSEAVRIADKAISQTQMKSRSKDASFAQGTPGLRALMMFAGPLLIINNRLQDAGLRGNGLHGTVKNPLQALGVWLAMAVGGSWVFDIIMGRGADDEDKDGDEDIKDWAIWAAKKLAVLPVAGIPLIREVGSYMDNGFVRPHPVVDAGKALVQAASINFDAAWGWLVNDEDSPTAEELAKRNLKAAGVAVGVPSNQLQRTGSYLMEVSTGEHSPEGPEDMWYLLQGLPKEKD